MKAWIIILMGLVIGLALGLTYAWQINPVQYYDSYPPLLYPEYRKDWIRMTTLAYSIQPNLTRTRLRLDKLDSEEIRQVMDATLAQAVTEGRPVAQLRLMAELAASYGVDTANVRIYTSAQLPPTPQPTLPVATFPPTPLAQPTPTATPINIPWPTSTPLPTLPPFQPYVVIEQQSTCQPQPTLTISLTQELTVTVRGRDRLELVGMPGVEFWLLWADGSDHAFTGLRPERGLGYADFAVIPAEAYNLYVTSPTGVPVATLAIVPCPGEGDESWTSWALTLQYIGEP